MSQDLSFETPIEEVSNGSEDMAHLDDLFEALTSSIDDEVEESKVAMYMLKVDYSFAVVLTCLF